jgi:hypothetical protein
VLAPVAVAHEAWVEDVLPERALGGGGKARLDLAEEPELGTRIAEGEIDHLLAQDSALARAHPAGCHDLGCLTRIEALVLGRGEDERRAISPRGLLGAGCDGAEGEDAAQLPGRQVAQVTHRSARAKICSASARAASTSTP